MSGPNQPMHISIRDRVRLLGTLSALVPLVEDAGEADEGARATVIAHVDAVTDLAADESWQEIRRTDPGLYASVVAAAAESRAAMWALLYGIDAMPCGGVAHEATPIVDTPPARPGDTRCAGCRTRETARAAQSAGGLEPFSVHLADEPDRELAAIAAAGADLLADADRQDRFRAAALGVFEELPTGQLEALHAAAGGEGGTR